MQSHTTLMNNHERIFCCIRLFCTVRKVCWLLHTISTPLGFDILSPLTFTYMSPRSLKIRLTAARQRESWHAIIRTLMFTNISELSFLDPVANREENQCQLFSQGLTNVSPDLLCLVLLIFSTRKSISILDNPIQFNKLFLQLISLDMSGKVYSAFIAGSKHPHSFNMLICYQCLFSQLLTKIYKFNFHANCVNPPLLRKYPNGTSQWILI